jgi:hypothetical protein
VKPSSRVMVVSTSAWRFSMHTLDWNYLLYALFYRWKSYWKIVLAHMMFCQMVVQPHWDLPTDALSLWIEFLGLAGLMMIFLYSDLI